MTAPLPFDPFILALGHIALASPEMESALLAYYAALVNDEAERSRLVGANYTEVRKAIDRALGDTPSDDVRTLLDDCDDAWMRRNVAMHSIWVVNDVGTYWAHKPGRRNQSDEAWYTHSDRLPLLAGLLNECTMRLVRQTKAVRNDRLTAQGKPPITGGIMWPIGRGRPATSTPLI